MFVLPPGAKLEPIAVNDLGDNIYATPALVDGRIYLRTLNTLVLFWNSIASIPNSKLQTPNSKLQRKPESTG